jgi:hypothetical protein
MPGSAWLWPITARAHCNLERSAETQTSAHQLLQVVLPDHSRYMIDISLAVFGVESAGISYIESR